MEIDTQTSISPITLFIEALLLVESDYYIVSTMSGGKIRERVFCYELYHQLRLLPQFDATLPLRVHGEIDKRGSQNSFKGKNPDFVFHVPGSMDNLLVVEVKGKISSPLEKDFDTICTFVSRNKYKVGIFLLYNHGFQEFLEKIKSQSNDSINLRNLWSQMSQNDLKKIIVVCKKSYEDIPEVINLNQLVEMHLN